MSDTQLTDILLQLNEKLTRIEERLQKLEDNVQDCAISSQNLQRDIGSIKESTANMDYHISFVESVYNAVKLPFARLLGANPVSLKSVERSAIEM